jgi:hypothetical protein
MADELLRPGIEIALVGCFNAKARMSNPLRCLLLIVRLLIPLHSAP